MRSRVLSICAPFAIGLAIVILAGCGGGSSDGSTTSSAAVSGTTVTAGSNDAHPGSGNNQNPTTGTNKKQTAAKHAKAQQVKPSDKGDKHKSSQPREGSSARRRKLHNLLEDVIPTGGGGAKQTATSPQEVEKVLEEFEQQADEHPADGGSGPNPVKVIVEQLGSP